MPAKGFVCRRCGACCRGEGSVFLYPEDIVAIAAHLALPRQETVDRYADFVILEIPEEGGSWLYLPYLVLRKDEAHTCLFLRERLCAIHDAKPAQCRETPFVAEFFDDAAWRADLLRACPALREADPASLPAAVGLATADRDHRYRDLLREHAYDLERILSVTLPAPRLIAAAELS